MTITGRNLEVKVNGTEFSMGDASPTALEILALAKTLGAIPNDPIGYILQGDNGQYFGDQQVDLEVDRVFITLPLSPAQAA